ncbi:MAG TPA: heat-inducible transcriptional repressor HrcA [Pelolinea sp.]|nr:heat-inducible transcriptional repressor HrcA [Pelolinea sp.]
MTELTSRQKKILSLIIHEHIRSAEPVGSRLLVDRYRLNFSPATIRNEMSTLTDAGFLRQPHTSAGREPTEEGYRFFVRQLMNETSLPDDKRHTINHQFSQMANDIKQWMQLAATVLANQTHAASLVTAPQAVETRVKHLELISTHGRQVLAILVLEGGQIHQNILMLEEPASQEMLSVLSNKFSQIFSGKNLNNVQSFQGPMTELESLIIAWIEEELARSDRLPTGEIYMDGITNVLSEPEFADAEEARRALRLLDERSILQDMLSRTILPETIGGVQVIIGGEGHWDDLRQCSVILSKYGSPGVATGTLGILGPMRMSYGSSISMVRYLSGILSDFITEQW